jgi:sugar phosphate isomerase/epimerase
MTELSMNQVTTFRWSFEEDIENFNRAGYRSIGVWRQKLIDVDVEFAVDLLAVSGLHVSNLSCAGGFTGAGGMTLRESIDDAAAAIRLAAAMQAGCLVVYPGGRNHHTWRHAYRLLRLALDELLPLAEHCEVPLALEPMHPDCAGGWTFLTDLESVMQLTNCYNSHYLQLAYDTYHFPWMPAERDLLVDQVSQLAVVYLSDRRRPPSIDQERCQLGSGQLPLDDFVAALLHAGYSGPFDVRLTGPEIESHDNWDLLESTQAAFAELLNSSLSRSLV